MDIETTLIVNLEEGETVRVQKVNGDYVVTKDLCVDEGVGKRITFE